VGTVALQAVLNLVLLQRELGRRLRFAPEPVGAGAVAAPVRE